MDDFISRKAAITTYKTFGHLNLRNVLEAFDAIHAADVQEVVMCKDCRYAYDSVGGWCCSHGVCVDCIVREDFFCADSEKKEG